MAKIFAILSIIFCLTGIWLEHQTTNGGNWNKINKGNN